MNSRCPKRSGAGSKLKSNGILMPSGTKTGSPEADTAFRKFRQFSPGKAVEILDQSSDQEQEFIKIWALARLLAWAILDQPGSRHRKTKVHRLQTKNAR